MTKYEIKDFETWLTAKEKSLPPNHLNYLQQNPSIWEQCCKMRNFSIVAGKETSEIILKWMGEIDQQREREREREREQPEEEPLNMINTQDWLNQQFPTPESKVAVKILAISDTMGTPMDTTLTINDLYSVNLTGEMDLNDFPNLEKLVLMSQKLVTIIKAEKLTKLTQIHLNTCSELTLADFSNCGELCWILVRGCPKLKFLSFLERWRKEIAQLKAQIQNQPNLLSQIQAKEAKITELNQQLTQEQTNQSQFQQQVSQLRQEINTLKEEIQEYLTKIQTLETNLSNQTQLLETEQTKNQELQTNLFNLQLLKATNEANLREQIKVKEAELEKEKKTSKTSTANLRKEIEELKEELKQSKNTSKQALEAEQRKLKDAETKLTQQITANQAQKQTIEQLERNLADSQNTLQAAQETIAQSQTRITQLETRILDHEQLKGRYEQNIEELNRELGEVKQEKDKLTQTSQAQMEDLNDKLAHAQRDSAETKETLQTKQEQLRKIRLEVAGLQAQLKKFKPETGKPIASQNEPINPWLLGTILVVVIGGLWLLKGGKNGN